MERVGLRAPVAELQSELHATVLRCDGMHERSSAAARLRLMTQRFEGVIGRDWRDSTPWWPPEPAAPPNAPNVLLIVLDDVGYAQLGCYGSDISTPDDRRARRRRRAARELPHHRAVLADAVVPAHRPQPSPQRHGPRRRPRDGLPRLLGHDPARERLPPRDPARARLRDVRGRQVAPHARRRGEHGRVARELAARPRLRPLVRVPRRRDAPVRAVALPRQPRGARARHLRRRLPPQRRPRRPRDRVPLRPARRRRRAAVLLLLRDRRVPLAAPRARRLDRAVPRPLRPGLGRVARSDVRAPDRERPAARRARKLSPRPHWVPAWDDLDPEDQAVAARFMECFAAFLSYTDAQIGRVLDYLEETGDLDNTLDRAVLRQRRQLRRRRARLDQRRAPLQRRGDRPRASCASASTSSAARRRTTTTRGAGRWPATRRSSAGSARCTRAASPIPASCGCPRRSAVHEQRRRSATSSRTRSTSCPTVLELARHRSARRRSTASRSRRSTARASSTRSATRTHPDATTRSTSRCSARARSTTTVGRR